MQSHGQIRSRTVVLCCPLLAIVDKKSPENPYFTWVSGVLGGEIFLLLCIFWRREGDSNPRQGITLNTLSRRAT